jgi:AhpD family alkylhydroperoxidase
LFAHLLRLMRQGKLTAEVFADSLPAFDGAIDALQQGVIPGAVERNREYVGEAIHIAPDVVEAFVDLGFDAQTSGGLLIAIAPERLDNFQQCLARRGIRGFVIGRVLSSPDSQIFLKRTAPWSKEIQNGAPVIHQPESQSMNTSTSNPISHHDGCCADSFNAPASPGSAHETQRAFGAMMRAVQSPGALNEKAKELILFSLVVQSRCEACFDTHYRRARELGITQAELDEAAWCAIAMGGAPVRVFYQENIERLQKNP